MQSNDKDWFRDQTRNDMDYISLLLEPFISHTRTAILAIPSELDVTTELLNHGYDLQTIVDFLLKTHAPQYYEMCNKYNARSSAVVNIQQMFKFSYKDNEDLQLDIVNKKIVSGGPLFVLRKESELNDENMLKKANDIAHCLLPYIEEKGDNFERAKEVVALFNIKVDKKFKSNRYILIREALNKALSQVKDEELMFKISRWFYKYIEHGCMASNLNLMKLKVMMHNNTPIYSIVEVE